MPPRSDNLETVLLALEILRRIPRSRKVTAQQIHAQLQDAGFARDIRTIQRQLDALSGHFDIEVDTRSKPYGYCWKANAQGFSLAQLTPQESLLLHLAKEHLSQLLPTRLTHSMDSFFVQAERTLNQHQHAQLEREWPRKIRVVATSQPLLPPQIKPNVLESVSEALFGNQYLDIAYTNASGKKRSSRVMPLGLAQQGPRLYLVCRFEDFDNERSLALHRIQKAAASGLQFERPKSFNLAQYDKDGRFGFGEGALVRLCFEIEAATGGHLRETPLSKDQQVMEMDGNYLRIEATVVDSAMLDWWLRGFGDAVRDVQKSPVPLP